MTLPEYLKARRAVETADPGLVAAADRLAEKVKARAVELVTTDRMWEELIRLAEAEQGHLFEVD
jgi:hypothetical protein